MKEQDKKLLLIVMTLLAGSAMANDRDAFFQVAADQLKFTGTYLLCEKGSIISSGRHQNHAATRIALTETLNAHIREILAKLNEGKNSRHPSDFTMIETKEIIYFSPSHACVTLNKVKKEIINRGV